MAWLSQSTELASFPRLRRDLHTTANATCARDGIENRTAPPPPPPPPLPQSGLYRAIPYLTINGEESKSPFAALDEPKAPESPPEADHSHPPRAARW